MEIDRLAYNLKEDKESRGKSLLEMLRKVPLVTVDGQGNIQIKGSSNYKIYINGKPNPIMDQDPQIVLRSIPASTIKKVEVITDPGVKYDAEGVGAILNIVTDTQTGDGVTGNISLNASYPLGLNSSLYLALKKGKFGLSTNLVGYMGSQKNMDTYVNYRNYSTGIMSGEAMTADNKYLGLYGNILMSYEIDKKNLLTINTNLRPGKALFESNGETKSFSLRGQEEPTLIGLNKTYNKVNGTYGSVSTGLDYQHSTDLQGELLTFSYRYNYTPNSSDQKYFLSTSDPINNTSKDSKTWNKIDAGMNEHSLQVDYVRPIKSSSIIEAGTKYIYRRSTSEPNNKYFDEESNSWNKTPTSLIDMNGSKFLHSYNIYSAYLAYSYKMNNWSVKTGVRGEIGKLNVEYSNNTKENFGKSYFDWIPEVTLDWKPTQQQQIKVNYNFRINRPNIDMLNPYEKIESNYLIKKGNPKLKPEKYHTVTLSYNLFLPKVITTLSAYYSFANNGIQAHYIQGKNGVQYSTFDNIAKKKNPGFNGFINWSATSWLRLITNFSVNYNQWESKELKKEINSWGSSTWIGAMITLKNDWFININGGFYKGANTLQTKYSTMYYDNYSVSKAFFNQKLTVSMIVSNPFRENIKYTRTTDNGQAISITDIRYPGRTFSLNLSYRFGSLKSQIKRTVRTIENDDIMQNNDSSQGIGGQQGGGRGM
ncbi:TonB-dependent receptor domain-containing protein [Falsiporphyromonas endometrii]|uniref:TonB-dependent receptor domain-containing protein n=1 Tax=Falsiporphyromonas endometrii TaxID=1387297 RepID=A0ABV9K6T5_9PORP